MVWNQSGKHSNHFFCSVKMCFQLSPLTPKLFSLVLHKCQLFSIFTEICVQ
uniref:Uncharacterized protein n=1 Tax=Anguilla anguilla TaxID=7936 RepID=A0A0E9XPP1_ANGAN